jgi:uncharacterized protein (TIGR00661 family)
MPARVLLVVHGRGRGHAMRARAIVPALRARGHEVDVWAGGAALDLLAGSFEVTPIECFAPGPGLARRFAARLRSDHRRLRATRFDVLVSDGDAPSMHAAASLGVPVVSVGHGLVFAFCRHEGLPPALLAREALNALSSSWLATRRVAVHFAEARPWTARTRVARIEIRDGLDRALPVGDHLVAYLRDGGADAWLEALVAAGERVLLFGERRAVPPGVERRAPDLDAFARALETAKGVVGTAGSNLVAEALHLGVPMLALYARDDVEQRLNATILERVGGGVGAPIEACVPRARAAFLERAASARGAGRRPDALLGMPSVAGAVVDAVERAALR